MENHKTTDVDADGACDLETDASLNRARMDEHRLGDVENEAHRMP